MLTNTSNKKTISNLLESLIEDYVHSNEMFDWCIEDDESYTVYSVKDDEDVHSSILLVGVARFIAAGLNAQIFTEEDNTITKLLKLERRNDHSNHEHIHEDNGHEHFLNKIKKDPDFIGLKNDINFKKLMQNS